MKLVLVSLVFGMTVGLVPEGQGSQTFVGTISDEMCGRSHAAMRMGPTDGECAVACHLEHDAAFVLVDGERVYKLSDQTAPKAHAGKRVKVVGTLDAATNTIHVESMTAG